MLKDFALTLSAATSRRRSDYPALLAKIKDRPYCGMLQTVMLRSLHQAVYTPGERRPLRLAYDATRTSLRRSAAIRTSSCIARIKAVLAGRAPGGDLAAIGIHCSETERRADEATRDVEAWLKSYFMQDHVGDEFDGTISAVTNFGSS
jgi:ribonuclease R